MLNFLEKTPAPKDALKSEHLKVGVRPIMACVGLPHHFTEGDQSDLDIIVSGEHEAHNVDYYKKPRQLKKAGFISPRHMSYVMSPVDGKNKFSETYRNCTGIIVAGVDKASGENISFMSHQDPDYFLKNSLFSRKRSKFIRNLMARLEEAKARCEEGTLDAVIFGGNYLKPRDYRNDYLRSIRLLSQKISQTLGFKPVVMTGPKIDYGEDDIFFDNQERKLFIMRPRVGDETSNSYSPSALNQQRNNWEKTTD